jgi:hypothetical protein
MQAFESSGAPEQEALFTYDTDVLGGSPLGRLSKLEYGPDVDGAKKYVERFRYSAGGLPLRKEWDVRVPGASGTLAAEWAYNNDGPLLEVTYPDGSSMRLVWTGWGVRDR